MKQKMLCFLICFFYFIPSLQAFEQKVIQANGLEYWTESFGKQEDPALLLIMGSGSQGLLWPQEFCEKLADKGYYVIRYDHRDVGLSSTINNRKIPYTLLDMAKDAIVILENYKIKKAHVVGFSMGGPIAMIMAAHFPDRISTITLMASSPDMRSNLAAIQGKPSESSLSAPQPVFLAWIKSYITHPPKTLDEKVGKFLEGGRILNGLKVSYDDEMYHQLALQSFIRTHDPESMFNHLKALEMSYDLYHQAASKIRIPTLIIQGDQDPIFPLDHGEAFKKAIPHSQLAIIQGMGHVMNARFYDILIEKIIGITQISEKK